MQARVPFVSAAGNPLRRSCASDARNAGESAIWPGPAQPSAEIVRVKCAKCRRECECDLTRSRATLCGDRACRVRELQARVESAICPGRGQPSAEIVRVECAKCRRECDLTRSCATLCGDRACRVRETQARVQFVPVRRNPLRRSCVSSARNAGESAIGELEDENWRLSSTTVVRGVSGELEDENWRLSRTTLVRGVSGELEDENWQHLLCNFSTRSKLWSWKLRTGDFVVQL